MKTIYGAVTLALLLGSTHSSDAITVLDEDFASGILPPGWQSIANEDPNAIWRFDDPGGRGNLTPGGAGAFAIIDSDHAGEGVDCDAELRTPLLDLTGLTDVTLRFATDLNIYPFDSDEIADVDVSIDGGSNWVNVFRHTEADGDFNSVVTVPIAIADNQPAVRFRFHYYNANFDFWWQIDDVEVDARGGSVAVHAVLWSTLKSLYK